MQLQRIVLITADSLRADFLNCYGYERAKTSPNLDRIAREGVLFKNAFSHSSWTVPSFAALLTSSYPLMFGGYNRGIKRRIKIAEVLSRHGYRTIAIHSSPIFNRYPGYYDGFEEVHDIAPKSDGRVDRLIAKFVGYGRTWGLKYLFNGKVLHYARAEKVTEFVKSVILNNAERRIFLWVHFMDSHHPYLPPKGFSEINLGNPIARFRYLKLFNGYGAYKRSKRQKSFSEEEKRNIKKLYEGEVRYLDHWVGELINWLLNEIGNSLVIFTSDHGDEFWEHGGVSHSAKLYDELIHVPLIIAGVDEGRVVVEDVVAHKDVATTILKQLNIEKPKFFYGEDLFDKREDHVICELSQVWAYRDSRYKLVEDHLRNRIELYDLKKDPHERNNVVKEEIDVAVELLKKLERHKAWEKREDAKLEVSKLGKRLE